MKWYNQSAAVFASRLLMKGFGFLGLIYFTTVLGLGPYGVYVLFASVTGMLGIFTDIGIRSAVEKRVSEGADGVLVTAMALKLPLLGLMAGIIIAGAGYLDSYIGRDVAVLVVAGVFLSEAGRLLLHKMAGELRIAERELTKLGRTVAFLGLSVLLIQSGLQYRALLYGYLLSWGVICLWLLLRVDVPLAVPRLSMARSLLSFAKFNFFASFVSSQVTRRMDVLVIGLFLAQSQVAMYEVAWQLSGIVTLLSSSIGNVLFPHVSSLHSSDNIRELQKLVSDAFTGTLFLTVPGIFGILLLRKEILRIVFDIESVLAGLALAILLVGRLGQSLNTVSGRVLLGLNRPDLAAISSTVLVVMNVGLNVLLVWQIGIVGAAVATTVALLVNPLITLYFAGRLMVIRFDTYAVFVVLAASIAMYVVLSPVVDWFAVDSLPALLVSMLAGASTYTVCTALYTPFRRRLVAAVPAL